MHHERISEPAGHETEIASAGPTILQSLITGSGRALLSVVSREAPLALATAQACSVASDPPAHRKLSELLPGGLPVLFRTPFREAVGPHHLWSGTSLQVRGDGAGGSAAQTAADPPAPFSFQQLGPGFFRTTEAGGFGRARAPAVRRLGESCGLRVVGEEFAAGLMDGPSDRKEQGLVGSVTRAVRPTSGRLGSLPGRVGRGLDGTRRRRTPRVGGGAR